jgi:hypothetical protein
MVSSGRTILSLRPTCLRTAIVILKPVRVLKITALVIRSPSPEFLQLDPDSRAWHVSDDVYLIIKAEQLTRARSSLRLFDL